MKNKYTLFFFAILVRLVLAIAVYHRDITAYITSSEFILLESNFFNFYDTVLERSELMMEFVYQPLSYFIPAIFYGLFLPIFKSTAIGLRQNDPFIIQDKIVYLPLLLYKLPHLLADLGVFMILPKFFKKKKHSNAAQFLWALSPIAIYTSAFVGQIDIVLVFFLTVSLFYNLKKKYALSAIFLTLSTLTKPVGVLIFPFLAVNIYQQTNSIKQTIKSLIPALVLLFAIILPFLDSSGYKASLFSYHLQKSSFAGIEISPGTRIPISYIVYSLTLINLVLKKIKFNKAILLVLLSQLAFTHFHVHWFIWVMPLLIYFTIKNSRYLIFILLNLSWIIITFSFTPDVHLSSILVLKDISRDFYLKSPMYAPLILLARSFISSYLIYLLVNPTTKKS